MQFLSTVKKSIKIELGIAEEEGLLQLLPPVPSNTASRTGRLVMEALTARSCFREHPGCWAEGWTRVWERILRLQQQSRQVTQSLELAEGSGQDRCLEVRISSPPADVGKRLPKKGKEMKVPSFTELTAPLGRPGSWEEEVVTRQQHYKAACNRPNVSHSRGPKAVNRLGAAPQPRV